MHRHGWSCQVPVRQALERDEDAVAVGKAEVWPQIKAPLATWAPISASRTRQARG
jgi:putative transposase